ncbi:MAG: lipoyl(octanoyl) transferase LipB [Fimbriimonadaceae bacterium]|nr:lipoyl(octanoyl) transferase LipB [Fimbriimonadaceae bacterium]
MAYRPAWDRQLEVHAEVLAGGDDTLVLVEHEPVVTLGANYHPANLRLAETEYAKKGIEVVQNDRGGDVTYHGPGQLVAYPVFDLRRHGQDLHRWMRELEETMLLVCASHGLSGRRFAPHTGAWVGDKKIAAIGVKVRKWVSFHGVALNCEPQPNFATIVPCGIPGYGVTSLTEEVGRLVGVEETKPRVVMAFEQVFAEARKAAAP